MKANTFWVKKLVPNLSDVDRRKKFGLPTIQNGVQLSKALIFSLKSLSTYNNTTCMYKLSYANGQLARIRKRY